LSWRYPAPLAHKQAGAVERAPAVQAAVERAVGRPPALVGNRQGYGCRLERWGRRNARRCGVRPCRRCWQYDAGNRHRRNDEWLVEQD
jgi:hypothetical protein